ncbi:DUF5688 family protein [Sellimonas sp.]|uniref:DUF5688 family protein n=1 Tax=Sellimonas sp. TaxID=2021466 RepID=UPI000B3707A3|nr:DUF5688 family protein [Sellimonas sp.]OUP62655.1 hypothetical protein B5F13_12785 [Drancourtella sp. An177]
MNNMLETKRQVTRKPESAEWLSYCRPAFCPQLTSPDENTVYIKMADLYVAAYLFLPVEGEPVKLRITKDLLEYYEISETDFWDRCLDNLEADACIQDMQEIVQNMIFLSGKTTNLFRKGALPDPTSETMYVVKTESNESNYGAAAILLQEVRRKLLECWPDGVYILPSSLHEVICAEKTDDPSRRDFLQETVKAVNYKEVTPEDRLSDSVYELLPSGEVVLA